MESFTPISALVGGGLIGLASAGLLLFQGRIAGITGILGGALGRRGSEAAWRWAFLGGLLAGGLVAYALSPERFESTLDRSLLAVAVAGALVGFGTRVGNGCTSGHGVCGISRMSPRSLVATCVFMGTGAATVLAVRVLFGGAL